MTTKQFLSSKVVFFCLLLVLAFLANAKYRQWTAQKAIDKEKQDLIKQAQTLQQQNQQLENSLAYINSPNYQDLAAKQQLNLKKAGEMVYGFTGQENSRQSSDLTEDNLVKKSNLEKWLEYFTKAN